MSSSEVSIIEYEWNLAQRCLEQQNFGHAQSLLRSLLQRFVLNSDLWLKLGVASHGLNQLNDALTCYIHAIRVSESDLSSSDAVMQYCLACLEIGAPDIALLMLNKFSKICDQQPRFCYQRGLAHLSLGQYLHGWSDYEYRFAAGCSRLPKLSMPRWNGRWDMKISSILVVCEQGFGDILQFLRFIPLLRQFFPRIGVLCPQPLARLLEALQISDDVICSNQTALSDYSCFIPLLSIPYALKLHHETDYRLHDAGYGGIESRRLEFAGRPTSSRLRVALNWQGNIEAESPMTTHRERSLQLHDLESIEALHHVDLLCVQHGPVAQQILHSSLKENLMNHRLYHGDFYDLACILDQCDILITNDTSVAHLGGVLGVQTWVALKKFPSWQWGYDDLSSLWYPSVKLFRQVQPFDWSSVMQEMNLCLRQLL
jgi:hypothetical protein